MVFTIFRGSYEAVFLLFHSSEGPRNYPELALKDVPDVDADCRGVRMSDQVRSLRASCKNHRHRPPTPGPVQAEAENPSQGKSGCLCDE